MSTKYLMKMLVIGSGVLGLTPLSEAAPITYTINRVNGIGSLTGTLTTDGTIGALAGLNFISSNLTVNVGSNSYSLVGLTYSSAGPFIPGATIRTKVNNGLVATSTQLLFDFGLAGGSNWGIQDQNASRAYCATGGFIACGGNELFGLTGGIQGVTRYTTSAAGLVVLGTASAGTATPEPTTSALMLTGLAAFLWRKRAGRFEARPSARG